MKLLKADICITDPPFLRKIVESTIYGNMIVITPAEVK